MMEQWNNVVWDVGMLDKCQSCDGQRIKNGSYPLKNQHSSIPQFHYSIVEVKTQATKISYMFIKS